MSVFIGFLTCAIVALPELENLEGKIVGVGQLRASGPTSAAAVSGDGSVVVGHSAARDAWKWTRETGITRLPGISTNATGVSRDGRTIVGDGWDNGIQTLACRWRDGVFQGLGDLPGGRVQSIADSVSDDGSVVVGDAHEDDFNIASLWNPSVNAIGRLEGQISGKAMKVSADGLIVIGTANVPGGSLAFRWTAATGMVPFRWGVARKDRSRANDISGDGATIVGAAWNGSGMEAVRHTAGGLQYLGVSPGYTGSSATSTNADGSVVVGYAARNAGGLPFIWTPAIGLTPFTDYLRAHGSKDPGHRIINEISGVSDDGTTFVGSYIHPVSVALNEGFVLKMPRPDTVYPVSYSVSAGRLVYGDLGSGMLADDHRIKISNQPSNSSVQVAFQGRSSVQVPTRFTFEVEDRSSRPGLLRTISAMNFWTNSYVTLDSRPARMSESWTVIAPTDSTRFVGPEGRLETRIGWKPIYDEDPSANAWYVEINAARWHISD